MSNNNNLFHKDEDQLKVLFWGIAIISSIGVLVAITFFCLSYFVVLPIISDKFFHISDQIVPYISLLISLFPILVASAYIVAFGVRIEKEG